MAANYGHGSAKVVEFEAKDAIYARILADAQEAVRREPDLAGFLFANVLHHETLERAIIHRVAARLDHPGDLGAAESIVHAYTGVVAADSSIAEAFRADILASIRPRSRLHAADRALALFQRLPRGCKHIVRPCAAEKRPTRFRYYTCKVAYFRSVPGRHQSRRQVRQGRVPRPCNKISSSSARRPRSATTSRFSRA